ncbi:MAG: hypothetical protein DMF85_17130 [Acidobacteria bacterium]|nr:MAG: hypothetical protein DMF85_17130 [Acidobacteriota bacterium]PYR75498.1 MAG: hypothetical protein DMF86_15140 [Acidobacteriota bacterium]
MYAATLAVHSWLRWVVLVLGVFAIVRAASAARARRWTSADDRASRWFTLAFDVQFLVGLLLYLALSPITHAAMRDFGGAMHTASLRYWAVEHPFGMIAGLALAHVGRARLRRQPPERRGRTALIFFILAVILAAASIPWPAMSNGRPLIRVLRFEP